ncbi:unnamed protein product [Rhizoctonia solani]|uniref:Protein kinase domain-containing protein n=1 Tax=Rhizoctonia solani TaxID=456999 RepID=A0A8H3BMN2_9AGAM|nr:unnamed protein product [Rhizoctonia solani]
MPIEDILVHLTNHGCEDVTHKLKIKSSSDYPVSNGGFGDVYRVGLQDGRQLAFKCVRLRVGTDAEGQKYLQRAAHELYVWSKCQHPNVMELTGVSQFRGQLAMVSPWVDNGDLKWFIGRYPKVDRCALVRSLSFVKHDFGRNLKLELGSVYKLRMESLTFMVEEYAAQVHGDLKAANILVSQDRVVKITDFGNAALAEYSLQFTSNAGGCSVSPRWTAPEILEEKTKTTVVGDIFALGMVRPPFLFDTYVLSDPNRSFPVLPRRLIQEVITGASPYDGVKDVVVSTKILNRVHPARPEAHIPTGSKHADRLWSLLLSCWEYDSQDRPTALQVRNEMKKITPKGLKSVP